MARTINQVRAKQYKISIHFKNELIGQEKYENYENIDLIGFNYPLKETEKYIDIWIDKENKKKFYLKKIRNTKTLKGQMKN